MTIWKGRSFDKCCYYVSSCHILSRLVRRWGSPHLCYHLQAIFTTIPAQGLRLRSQNIEHITLEEHKSPPTATLQIAISWHLARGCKVLTKDLGMHYPFCSKCIHWCLAFSKGNGNSLVSAAPKWTQLLSQAFKSGARLGSWKTRLPSFNPSRFDQSLVLNNQWLPCFPPPHPPNVQLHLQRTEEVCVLQVVLPETGRLAAAAERRASTAAVESKEISLAKKSVASIAFWRWCSNVFLGHLGHREV